MVQDATIAPITLLLSEVRAALPHTLCQQLLQGHSSPVEWDWLWPGCRGVGDWGLPLDGAVPPPYFIPHMTGGGKVGWQ